MNVNDYLIDQEGKDWSELLSDWGAVLPASFTIWLVNRFGDLIVVLEDESVHILDVGAGRFSRIADGRDHFANLLDVQGNADEWLLASLVDRCVAADMRLGSNQCYGFKVPPILNGKYAIENIEPTDLSVHYSLLAQIFKQTRALGDGARVRRVTIS